MKWNLLGLYTGKTLTYRYLHTLHVRNLVNRLISTSDPFHPDATEIIDVRSPAEFSEDHIPGAINLPVLGNKQREEVGKLYSTNSFCARKIGGKLVVSNIAEILETHFFNKDKNYRPLVYCWRGGQRSRSLATILSEVGFDVFLLDGGYKTYRKLLREDLVVLPEKCSYRVISGRYIYLRDGSCHNCHCTILGFIFSS